MLVASLLHHKTDLLRGKCWTLQPPVQTYAATETHWPPIIDYSQCDATRHITMLIQLGWTVKEGDETISGGWDWQGVVVENKWMAVGEMAVSMLVLVCPIEGAVTQSRSLPSLPCPLNMAYHHDEIWKRAHRGRTDQTLSGWMCPLLSFQLPGRERTQETKSLQSCRICNLPVSRHPGLALAFQGESWKIQTALHMTQKNNNTQMSCNTAE